MTEKEVKYKINFDEMIEKLKDKGVSFDKYSETDAKEFLRKNNYYFKLTSYRKNFFKDKNDGKYIMLDFKHMVDLASIDMQLRYLILRMCLDLEHILKTVILSDITNDPSEDGYSIVQDYVDYKGITFEELIEHVNSSNKKLYDSHVNRVSVWVLFEVMHFGEFTSFLNFYYSRKQKPKRFEDARYLIYYIKNLRNAAAHNSCIINDIIDKDQTESVNRNLTQFANSVPGLSKGVITVRLSNMKVRDLTALMYLYDNYVKGERMKKARFNEMRELLNRCKREEELYSKHQSLKSVYFFFDKVVAHLGS